jgi:hypothetical protein
MVLLDTKADLTRSKKKKKKKKKNIYILLSNHKVKETGSFKEINYSLYIYLF